MMKQDLESGRSNPMVDRARALRRKATASEAILWQYLRNRALGGLRFRRQHIFGQFIVDFYCHAARLVVEIDGSVHDGQQSSDTTRTECLAFYGLRVIRFGVADVETRLGWVLATILEIGNRRVEGDTSDRP